MFANLIHKVENVLFFMIYYKCIHGQPIKSLGHCNCSGDFIGMMGICQSVRFIWTKEEILQPYCNTVEGFF